MESVAWVRPRFVHPNIFLKALRESVVGQKELLPKLAYSFSHYTAYLDSDDVGRPIPLTYGPSGAGKTYAIELCCEISGLNITGIGGGGVSAAGYKGLTMRDLVTQHFSRYMQEEGVIFVDEMDKWCRGYIAQYEKPDPEVIAAGLSKQAETLRYMEREVIDFIDEAKDYEELKGQTFDTSRTFWIFGGAFVGLDAVVRSRTGQEQIATDEIWSQAEPVDFIKYGMIEEFANRVTSWAWVKPLTSGEIMRILDEQDKPKWVSLFERVGVQLDLDSSALAAAANTASTNKRGPRGAKMYLNRTLGDVYTEAAEREMTSVTVDAEVMLTGRLPVAV